MLGRQFELVLHHWLAGEELKNWKYKLFSVGGFVRDFQINRESHDVDLMVTFQGGSERLAHELKNRFKDQVTQPLQMGSIYPIWSIEFKDGEFKGLKIDIADSQKEMFPKNDERQRIASFGTFDEDIQRRDFTVNMLARDLTTDQIIDQSGVGLKDLEQQILRTHPLVDAGKILSDDPLRMIRAVRFACTHGFKIDQVLFFRMQEQAERIRIVSAERILMELTKMVSSGRFRHALELFLELKLVGLIFSDAIEKMLSDPKIQKEIFKIIERTESKLSYQMAAVFYFLSPLEVDSIATKLKFSQKQKREISIIIGQTEKLLLLNSNDFLEVRSFLRNCELSVNELVRFASAVSEDFLQNEFLKTMKKVTAVPINNTPILDGNEISKLLNISGAEIKIAKDLLFKIEDQFVMENAELPSKLVVEAELLKRFKG